MNDADLDLKCWIGRSMCSHDVVSATTALGLRATLDSINVVEPTDGISPYLSHWLYFLPNDPMRLLGEDGHPMRGGFLPPVALPLRMWAGSRVEFLRALRIGAEVTRRSTIGDIREKNGRTGPLVFVRVDHEIYEQAEILVRESQDIVYRGPPPLDAGAPPLIRAPDESEWVHQVIPNPVLLFRYSALTFNSHRIHYDYPYATSVEGYAGLVVQGPLIATLLLNELVQRRPDFDVTKFEFRAVSPLIVPSPCFVCGSVRGSTASLFARNVAGDLYMQASAELRRKGQ